MKLYVAGAFDGQVELLFDVVTRELVVRDHRESGHQFPAHFPLQNLMECLERFAIPFHDRVHTPSKNVTKTP